MNRYYLKLYPGRIVIPKPVYSELSLPSVIFLKNRIDTMVNTGHVIISEILVDSEEYLTYYQLTEKPILTQKLIGKGEASSIALALKHNGILASNNLKDISLYINAYNLKHITTGDILLEALHLGYINEDDGNTIWKDMLLKRRKLGAQSFTDYIIDKG